MKWKISLFLVLFLFSACSSAPVQNQEETKGESNAQKDTTVSIQVGTDKQIAEKSQTKGNKADLNPAPVYTDFTKEDYADVKGKKAFVLFFYNDADPILSEIETDIATFPEKTVILRVAYTKGGELEKELNITAESTFVVYDLDGNIIYRAVNPDLSDLKAAIERSMKVV